MLEHFISNKDVEKYDLYEYVHRDQFGRYKLLKYVSRKLSQYCIILRLKDFEYNHYLFWMKCSGERILSDIKTSLDKNLNKQRAKKLRKLKDASG